MLTMVLFSGVSRHVAECREGGGGEHSLRGEKRQQKQAKARKEGKKRWKRGFARFLFCYERDGQSVENL